MRFCTAILILFMPFCAFSQKILVETSNNNKKTVQYNRYPDEEQKISNYFLEQMSEKDAYFNASYEYEYLEVAKLYIENNKQVLSYRLSDFKFKGSNTLKKTDVSKLLLPSVVNSYISLLDKDNKELLSYRLDTCCLTNPRDIHEWKIAILAGDSLKAANCKAIKINALKLSYNQKDLNRFNEYVQLIDEYYKTNSILNDITETLGRIKTDNIDMMPLFQVDMNNVKKSIDKIENQKFFTQLDLTANDPIDFKNRFKQLKEKYTSQSMIVSHLMSSIDEVYFNKGYSFYLKKNYEKAIEYFERSIRSNNIYVRAYYRLSEVYFISGNIDKSAETILYVLQKLKIEKDIESNVLALAQQIMLEYVDRGEIKVRNEEFHQALKEFEKADIFCKSTTLIACDSSIYRGIESARLGLYKSYLTISAKAIEGDKIELAAKFIYDAKKYLNEIGNLNINHKETDEIIEKVINILINQGRAQYDNKNYEAAVGTYNKAMDLCKLCSNSNCNALIENETKNAKTKLFENILVIIKAHLENESIETAEDLLNEALIFQKENKVTNAAIYETENLLMTLDKLKYKQYISKGQESLNLNFNKDALDYFLKAKALEKDKVAFPDYNLNFYIQCVGKPLLLDALSEAKLKAWSNDIPKAKNLERTIKLNIATYLLTEDSTVMCQYNDLVNRIKDQECANLDFEVDKKFLSAKRFIEQSDYITAFDMLKQSRETLRNLNYCPADSLKIISLQKDIYDLYCYQINQKLIAEAILNLKFEKSDSLFKASHNLYESSTIVKSNLKPYLIEEVLKTIYDCSTLKLLAEYYLETAQLENSLAALQRAKVFNCKVMEYNDIQKILSVAMASRDYKAVNKLNIETQFKNYNLENEWFVVFKKSYKNKILKLKLFLK